LPQGVEYVGIEDQSSSQGSNVNVQGFDAIEQSVGIIIDGSITAQVNDENEMEICKGSTKAISSFTFDNTPIPILKREYIVEIECEGIRKTEVVSYAIEEDNLPHWQSHGNEQDPTAASPLRDIIDSRINPVTTRGLQMRGMDVMNIPQELLLQGSQQSATLEATAAICSVFEYAISGLCPQGHRR